MTILSNLPSYLSATHLLSDLPTTEKGLTMEVEGNIQWNRTHMQSLWVHDPANLISTIPIRGTDSLCCGNEAIGTCTLKSFYRFIQPIPTGPHLPWKRSWNLPIPSKINFFGWKWLPGRLPTALHFIQTVSPTCV